MNERREDSQYNLLPLTGSGYPDRDNIQTENDRGGPNAPVKTEGKSIASGLWGGHDSGVAGGALEK